MKIIVVGEFRWNFYHEACSKALEQLDHDVTRFGWSDIFFKWLNGKSEPIYKSIWHRIQYGLLIGPLIKKVNRNLLSVAINEKPEIIWLHMATVVRRKTILEIKKRLPSCKVVIYTHDNPFAPNAKFRLWKNFYRSIPIADVCVSHRKSDYEG